MFVKPLPVTCYVVEGRTVFERSTGTLLFTLLAKPGDHVLGAGQVLVELSDDGDELTINNLEIYGPVEDPDTPALFKPMGISLMWLIEPNPCDLVADQIRIVDGQLWRDSYSPDYYSLLSARLVSPADCNSESGGCVYSYSRQYPVDGETIQRPRLPHP